MEQKLSKCCRSPCLNSEYQDEYGPCDGEVEVVDEEWDGEDYYWIHYCEKHAQSWRDTWDRLLADQNRV